MYVSYNVRKENSFSNQHTLCKQGVGYYNERRNQFTLLLIFFNIIKTLTNVSPFKNTSTDGTKFENVDFRNSGNINKLLYQQIYQSLIPYIFNPYILVIKIRSGLYLDNLTFVCCLFGVHSYGDATIAGEGLQTLTYTWHLLPPILGTYGSCGTVALRKFFC